MSQYSFTILPVLVGIGALIIKPIREDLRFSIVISILTIVYIIAGIYTSARTNKLGVTITITSAFLIFIISAFAYLIHKNQIATSTTTIPLIK